MKRDSLIRALADSLILEESIMTTLPRAKAVARYTERLISNATKGKNSLYHRRMVIGSLNTIEAAHKLVDELAPRLSNRGSGYFRIEKAGLRRGDNAQLAKVSFVDDLKIAKKSQKDEDVSKRKPEATEGSKEAEVEPRPRAAKETESKIRPKLTVKAQKRSGVRGNR